MESITESLINHRHIEPPTEGLLLCKYSELTFLHNRELIKANVREGSERDSEQKSGNAEAFQSIKRSNQRHKALKSNNKFFFFDSLFLFSSPKKEKVNKEQTISKVLSDKLKRKVRGGYAPRKAAFTLAEVLITLGIIGIVAAMTLPTLIQNQQEKEKVVRLKKAYSVLNSAIQRAITEDGPISSWSGISKSYSITDDMSDEEKDEITQGRNNSTKAFMSHIKPYLNFLRYCIRGDDSCMVEEYNRYSLDGTQFDTMFETSILADGTGIIDVWFYDPACKRNYGKVKALQNICGEMFVDIKANNKGRKITGDTVFLFYITEFGLYPMGSAMENQNSSDTAGPYNFETHCNISQSKKLNGYGCTAWVLENENLDYKKCSDLSWSGKRKCK